MSEPLPWLFGSRHGGPATEITQPEIVRPGRGVLLPARGRSEREWIESVLSDPAIDVRWMTGHRIGAVTR